LQLEQQNQRQLIALREQELARLGLELAELKEPGPLRVRICRPCWSNSAILRRSSWPVTSGSRSWIVS
jgi:hypothetical protein